MKGTEILDALINHKPITDLELCFVVSSDIHRDLNFISEYKSYPVYEGFFKFEKDKAIFCDLKWYTQAVENMYFEEGEIGKFMGEIKTI